MMVKKLICLVMTLAVAVSCFGVSAVATEVRKVISIPSLSYKY